jgi:hypothetical protein
VAEIVDERAELIWPTSVADLARSVSQRRKAAPCSGSCWEPLAQWQLWPPAGSSEEPELIGCNGLPRVSVEDAGRRGQPGSAYLRMPRSSGQTRDTTEVQKLAIFPESVLYFSPRVRKRPRYTAQPSRNCELVVGSFVNSLNWARSDQRGAIVPKRDHTVRA